MGRLRGSFLAANRPITALLTYIPESMYNSRMLLRRVLGGLSVALAVAGCGTIFEARQAQRAFAPKGLPEAAPPVEKFDLTDYSLRELVEFAMTNRPSIISAALAVKDARLALQEIAADAPLVSYSPWTSPHLNASGGYDAASESSRTLTWFTDGRASAGLSLQILLYDFGRNQARASAQVENVISAEHAFIKEGYQVFEDVATAYFNLMERAALLEVSITNELEYAEHLRQAEELLLSVDDQNLSGRRPLHTHKTAMLLHHDLLVKRLALCRRHFGEIGLGGFCKETEGEYCCRNENECFHAGIPLVYL